MTDESRIEKLMSGEKPVEVSPSSANAAPSEQNTSSSGSSVAPQSAPAKAVVPPPTKPTLTTAVPAAGAKPVAAPRPVAPVQVATTSASATSLTAAVNKAQGASAPIPKGLTKFNTRDLEKEDSFFHGLIFGDTSVRKTSTAALFDSPENTRIILTRKKEQLLPLRDAGYEVALVDTPDAFLFALQYPERVWPELLTMKSPTLVVDDLTEGIALMLEGAKDELEDEKGGREVKDPRRTYGRAGENLRETIKILRRKPMNLVLIALAKVKENQITKEEVVVPDLPPSMNGMLTTDLEFVFYIRPDRWKLVTDRDFFSITEENEKGQKTTYRREIFAKHKLPLGLIGKGIVQKEEEMNLRKLWEKIRAARGAK